MLDSSPLLRLQWRFCFRFFVVLILSSQALSSSLRSQEPTASRRAEGSIRFATFNISFYRKSEGELKKELQEKPESAQPRKVAEIIQRVRPDVLLLNEFDYDKNGEALAAFQKNFLEVAQGEQAPIKYPYSYVGPVNTGVDTKIDLDGDGKTGTGNDCYGFGRYPGQYGMAILSRYPIDQDNVRTFQRFRWTDMPNHQMPFKVGTQDPYYSDEAIEVFRLSSKSHWDVPIKLNNQDSIHFLVAHPTPPVFDQEEDRNGRRNHDEIRMFADYVTPDKADYLYDDQGGRGGLAAGVKFVIAGDMNADPNDGDSSMSAANQLTEHPLINHSIDPSSSGGAHYAKSQGGKNLEHKGPANTDTGDFGDSNVGNLRIDYCLPSKNLELIQAGVFWPKPGEPGAKLINASDHRMVWIDLKK